MNEGRASGDLELRPDGPGTRLRVRVRAGASRSRILGVHAGALKVAVASPAEKGRANREVLRLVAEVFGLAPRHVEILAGQTFSDKVVGLSLPAGEAAVRWAARAAAPDTIAWKAAGVPRKP